MLRSIGVALLLCVIALLSTVPFLIGQDSGSRESAEAVLREASDFLGSQDSYECRMSTVIHIVAPGMDNKMKTVSIFRLERPKKFALKMQTGMNGVDLVSDGKTLTTHIPMLQKYSQAKAPATIAESFDGTAAQAALMGIPVGGVVPFGGEAFFDAMMEGVNKSTYVGESDVNGTKCHHCRFDQAQFSWEAWIEKGDQPLIRKIAVDISAQMGEASPMFKDAKMDFYVTFDEWSLRPKFDDQSFRFDPPEDAEKVDDLFGEMFDVEPEGPHPLLGLKAPSFQAKKLNGESLDTNKAFNDHIVILDFWASWCGPCVEALPAVAKVADEYKDRGVKFFAVNVGEEANEVREFLKTIALQLDVVLDSDGEISDQYQADAIPQTVIVGRNGDVQVVHVGMIGNLEEQLSDELDRLLNGEDLAANMLAEAEAALEKSKVDNFGSESLWSLNGRFAAIAVDRETSRAIAVAPNGKATFIGGDGAKAGAIMFGQGDKIRLANLIGGGDAEVLIFGAWGKSVTAYSMNGQELWEYAKGQGIDDVWAADLDGNGTDEVIIGYNGGTGLHVLDQRGNLLWKRADIGNVWHVTAGDVNLDGQQEVVTTSAEGNVHIFSADGKTRTDIKLSTYASMVRVANEPVGQTLKILAVGSGNSGEELVACQSSGKELFRLALDSGEATHIDEMIVSSDGHWAGVAMRGGIVEVVDIGTGEIIAKISGQGSSCDVAWYSRDSKSPMLLVATGRGINAFEIVSTTPSN